MSGLKIKRVYETPTGGDGYRILVDRLWPRGVKKEDAKLNEWQKDLGPSNELRKWFGHDPALYEEFKKKYEKELLAKSDELKRIKELSKTEDVTLVYSAKDTEHNQATVLMDVLSNL